MPHEPTTPLKKILKSLDMDDQAVEDFFRLYNRYRKDPQTAMNWKSIQTPDESCLLKHSSLKNPSHSKFRDALSRFAICKLNGGLGTSMGCRGPKSSIPVRGEKTFLDLTVEQISGLKNEFHVSVPLILMDSFHTHQTTKDIIRKYHGQIEILTFQQNKFPRLLEGSEIPPDREIFQQEVWYPPGHGDFYARLHETGLLDNLIDQGREVLFVSNADNLGAVTDPGILNYMLDSDVPFLIEMTEKTVADVKGGTLYRQDGILKLLEVGQVPREHMEEFCGFEKFRVFNTNNLWIHLRHLKKKLEEGPLELDLIVNRKTVYDQPVIQLETAMGSAVAAFSGAVGLIVSRDRFLPVKKTDDLLLVQSDLFNLENGFLKRNPRRKEANLPLVRLGDSFTDLENFQHRFPRVPSLIELVSLEIDGDVRFEGEVEFVGNIRLVGRQRPLTFPNGIVLENKVIEQ